MKTLANLLDRLPVDNKLLASLLSLALTRVLVGALGVDPADELLSAGVPALVAALVGYNTHNEGSVLRRGPGEDGNAAPPGGDLPDDEAVPGDW